MTAIPTYHSSMFTGPNIPGINTRTGIIGAHARISPPRLLDTQGPGAATLKRTRRTHVTREGLRLVGGILRSTVFILGQRSL